MDIRSKGGYPSSALSNFAPHKFVIDGVECASMEGFLQSLKCPHSHVQVEICKLAGKAAKKRGAQYKWQKKGKLYWRGVEYERQGEEYQKLLDRAYNTLTEQNEGFRKAILTTQNAVLAHSMGKRKKSETILTSSEFCSRLTSIRERLKRDTT